jgi:hypothetical protein
LRDEGLVHVQVPQPGRGVCSSGNEWSGMFFITIIDFDLKTISYQIAGKIAAHMTQANDADPPCLARSVELIGVSGRRIRGSRR